MPSSDWNADEYARFFTSNRASLVGISRRILDSHELAEEVVQEAFLYVLTASPELGTELDLRRYLKWKVRNLSIDLLRKRDQRELITLPHEEAIQMSAAAEAPSEIIERAEDTAIVHLALSRLDERQRKALIWSTFAEYETSEIGARLGLNNNAVAQLIYRAKRSFRLALVAEAEEKGMSTSEVLGIPTKKFVTAALKVSSAALTIFLTAGLAFNYVNTQTEDVNLASTALDFRSNAERRLFGLQDWMFKVDLAPSVPTDPFEAVEMSPENQEVVASTSLQAAPMPNTDYETVAPRGSVVNSLLEGGGEGAPSSSEAENSLTAVVDLTFDTESLEMQFSQNYSDVSSRQTLELYERNGVVVSIVLSDSASTTVQSLILSFSGAGNNIVAIPMDMIESRIDDSTIQVAATNFVVGDFNGMHGSVTTTETLLFSSALILDLTMDSSGAVSGESRFIPAKSSGEFSPTGI